MEIVIHKTLSITHREPVQYIKSLLTLAVISIIGTGFPQLLKNHWNSDLFQDHGKIIEFHEKFLKFVKMKKSWKNHWILDQLLMEKLLNF